MFQLRDAQSRLEELETTNNHLIKRFDKLKNARSNLLKDLSQDPAWGLGCGPPAFPLSLLPTFNLYAAAVSRQGVDSNHGQTTLTEFSLFAWCLSVSHPSPSLSNHCQPQFCALQYCDLYIEQRVQWCHWIEWFGDIRAVMNTPLHYRDIDAAGVRESAAQVSPLRWNRSILASAD